MDEDAIHKEIAHALELLELTLPTTQEELEKAKRVQLYNWEPARYANLTNNPKQYMKNFKKAEDMTKKIQAAYSLLSAVLVPEDSDNDPGQPTP
jgi:DNA-binding transcriptional regulator LsrR (DeoR family)